MISRLIKSSVDSLQINWFQVSKKCVCEFSLLKIDFLSAGLKLGKELDQQQKRDNRKYQFVPKKLVNFLLLVFSRKIWLIESFNFIGDCLLSNTFRLFFFFCLFS